MHELSITESIVAGLREQFPEAKLNRVVLEIGAMTAVVPDAIRFCFDVCTEGTPLEGASLEIVSIPARVKCRTCQSETELSSPLPLCPCGSANVQLLAGNELLIRSVEVA